MRAAGCEAFGAGIEGRLRRLPWHSLDDVSVAPRGTRLFGRQRLGERADGGAQW